MSKAPPPLRIALDLSDDSLTALLLRPDGHLRHLRTEFPPGAALETVFSRLCAALLPPEHERQASGSPTETILSSSRPISALHRGVRIALIITEGFEDMLLLEDAHNSTPSILPGLRFAELCPRELCLPIKERLGADGNVILPLTSEALTELCQRVTELKVAAVAVVLLHSYQNDAHERTVAEALAPLGLPVSLSSCVARVPDERLRARATVLDACLAPSLREELSALRAAGLSRVLCADAAGDIVPAAQLMPLRRLLSTAAIGLCGVQRLLSHNGMRRCLVLGIDKRSAAVALCDPALELDAGSQLGLELGIDLRTEEPAQELRLLPLPDGVEDGDALQEQLLEALLAITIERGHDPGDYPLICYGRIKPALAAALAERLGTQSVLILPTPSLVVAYGSLCAPLVCQRRELLFVEASSAQQTGQVAATLHALTERLRTDLKREGYLSSDHLSGGEWLAELRYQSQGAGQSIGQLPALYLIGLGDGSPAVSGATDLVVRFCAEHQRRYGYTLPECPVELVALRVRVTIPVTIPHHQELSKLAESAPEIAI